MDLPACSTHIRHVASETVPHAHIVYRCHVCRLELVLDETTQKMTVAPFAEEPQDRDR
jgi:hypothetical protein